MPTYVYKFVETGETIEVQQAFTDDTLVEYAHPDSGDLMAVKKVFQPVGVTFKGSGFFKNDHRGSASASTGASSTNANASSSTSSDSSGSSSDSSGSSSDSSGSSSSSSSSSTSSAPTTTSSASD